MSSHDRKPTEAYRDNVDLAIQYLADRLREGSLSLFIGSGASKGVGLPVWWELVARCQDAAGLPVTVTKDSSNEDIRRAADDVETAAKTFEAYAKVVHDSLYRDASYAGEIITSKLLIALGALMMGSRRGSVREVLTFNFDDVLEWYLMMHGFRTDVVTYLPHLGMDADVTIYHPHGYLPKVVGRSADHLILSDYSYDKKLGEQLEPWSQLTRELLARRIPIFVGLSNDDPALGAIVTVMSEKLLKYRPLGFWLLGPDAPDDAWFLRREIVPLRFASFDDYPSFLLSICQRAAGTV